MTSITQSSNKLEIIDSACELIDLQSQQIKQLQERQTILGVIAGVLLSLVLLFS